MTITAQANAYQNQTFSFKQQYGGEVEKIAKKVYDFQTNFNYCTSDSTSQVVINEVACLKIKDDIFKQWSKEENREFEPWATEENIKEFCSENIVNYEEVKTDINHFYKGLKTLLRKFKSEDIYSYLD